MLAKEDPCLKTLSRQSLTIFELSFILWRPAYEFAFYVTGFYCELILECLMAAFSYSYSSTERNTTTFLRCRFQYGVSFGFQMTPYASIFVFSKLEPPTHEWPRVASCVFL